MFETNNKGTRTMPGVSFTNFEHVIADWYQAILSPYWDIDARTFFIRIFFFSKFKIFSELLNNLTKK